MRIPATELQKASYFLTEIRNISDSDFMDSGMIDYMSELIVAYNEFTHKKPSQPALSLSDAATNIIEQVNNGASVLDVMCLLNTYRSQCNVISHINGKDFLKLKGIFELDIPAHYNEIVDFLDEYRITLTGVNICHKCNKYIKLQGNGIAHQICECTQ